MTERLKLIIDHLGLSVLAFAKSIDASQQMLFNYTKGRTPSLEVIQKILTVYPQFNVEWLVLGKGEMLRNEAISKQNDNNNTTIEQLLEQLTKKDKLINHILDELSEQRKENSKLMDMLIKEVGISNNV